jgi:hypothetical protein
MHNKSAIYYNNCKNSQGKEKKKTFWDGWGSPFFSRDGSHPSPASKSNTQIQHANPLIQIQPISRQTHVMRLYKKRQTHVMHLHKNASKHFTILPLSAQIFY